MSHVITIDAAPIAALRPLAPFVLALFDTRESLDVAIVSYKLAGGMMTPMRAGKAYQLVAQDVLGCLQEAGVLEHDGHWYRLATTCHAAMAPRQ